MIAMFESANKAIDLFNYRKENNVFVRNGAAYEYESDIKEAVRLFFPEYRSYGVGFTERFIGKLMEWDGERYANISMPDGGVEIDSFSDVPLYEVANSAYELRTKYSIDMETKMRVKSRYA